MGVPCLLMTGNSDYVDDGDLIKDSKQVNDSSGLF